MNKVFLTGRFTRDPESRMGGNVEVSRFSLACQNDFMTKSGERDVEFINCVAFGKTAETINKFCKKGQQICATGRIKNNSYDAQDGSKRYTTDVIVDQFEFLGAKSNGSSDNSYNNNSGSNYINDNIETTDVSEDPYQNYQEEIEISSEDLPF